MLESVPTSGFVQAWADGAASEPLAQMGLISSKSLHVDGYCDYFQRDILAMTNSRDCAMKNKTTAAMLALFLGGPGMHRFYLGKWVTGLLYLIFCWTFAPAIFAFFEAIFLFMKSDEAFNAEYNQGAIAFQNGERVSPDTHVKCPDCAELIKREARVCKHCGCRLVPQ